MEELFDLIRNNLFIVIIIIGAIVKLLGGSSKKEEEQNRRTPNRPKGPYNNPRPTRTPSGGGYHTNQSKPVAAQTANKSTVQTVSIEEQQQKQLERLAGRMSTGSAQSFDGISKQSDSDQDLSHHAIGIRGNGIKKGVQSTNLHNEKFKKQIKGKLTGKGLVDSVIMAEVLGPPKARKPYRSIISDR